MPALRPEIASLSEARKRIEQLEDAVEQLRDYISILTMALSEHTVVPSVAGDVHLIKVADYYKQDGRAHQRALHRCLKESYLMHPVLTRHQGHWVFKAEPELPTEREPKTVWGRIQSDE